MSVRSLLSASQRENASRPIGGRSTEQVLHFCRAQERDHQDLRRSGAVGTAQGSGGEHFGFSLGRANVGKADAPERRVLEGISPLEGFAAGGGRRRQQAGDARANP